MISERTHSNVVHLSILQFLLEFISSIFQPLTRSLDVIDTNTDVSEALSWILVAVVWLVGSIVLSAIVVSELNDALAISPVVPRRCGFGRIVCELQF